MTLYVFDVDGTLANMDHRRHHVEKSPKDWVSFFADSVLDTSHAHIVKLLNDLQYGNQIAICTGRREDQRELTEAWLRLQNVRDYDLYMRALGDYRTDHIIKSELADEIIYDYGPIDMVFDDRDAVVRMWRARGIPCAQVAYGNF